MPKQKRWQLKRQLEQAENDIDRASRNIVMVAAQFEGVHQAYFEYLSLVLQALEQVKPMIDKVKEAI